jgi:UDP-glucose 4-epimerase
MNILITGGFGLVGGRLAKYLDQIGHHITLGSRNKSDPPDWLSHSRVLQTDWSDESSLEHICSEIDVVIQAAGMNACDCKEDPVAALEFNGLATARLHRAASRANVIRFIYLSTAHVYASPLIGRISEDSFLRNFQPYATSHLAGENAVLFDRKLTDMKSTVLRLSNAFGAPTHSESNCWMLLVNDLCRQAVCDRKLVLRSAGLQRRDFVTLHDVVSAISHIITSDTEEVGGKVFNIGGAWAPRIIDMVELIQARSLVVLGFTPNIIHPEPNDIETTSDMNFRIDKLLSTGFVLSANVLREIDETLLFCHKAFGDH